MKNVFLIILGICILVLFVGTGYFLYQKSEEKPVVFETEKPFVQDIIKKTVATGSIKPRKEIEIKSQVPGVIEKIYVEAGQIVKEGQLLAKIRIIPNMVNLNNAETQLNNAKINFENSQIEYDRQKGLYEEKVISNVEYNQASLDFKLNKEALEAAENNLQLIKVGASKKAGQVTNEVKATVSGMLLDVPVKEGSFVIESNTFNEGTTIASIADMQSLIFEGKVDESEVGKIKEGMDLLLTIGAIENEQFNAKLEYISPKGIDDQGSIKFEIKAALLLSEKDFLRAGYSANADIVLAKKEQVMAVKESNLIFEDDKVFIEVETSPQNFEKRQITTGISDGINIEVLSGIDKDANIKKII
ncbi:MAG: efflux RND transporter periplasmic adaptor subunit [Bacteroidota bacterium]|nr:efflux RND transporter periplasmic adaptor subunit [Bacteroidota bacterium]